MHPFEKVANLQFLVEDYITTSYNLGVLWEPYPWFALGACYQSEAESNMKGKYKFKYSQRFQNTVAWLGKSPMTIIAAGMFDLPYQAVPTQEGTANLKMTWPSNLQVGVKLRPIKQLILTCDAHRTDWEAWPELRVDFDQKIQLFRFTRMLGYMGGSSPLVTDFGFKNTCGP
jgi:long-subunit fatty acid transport protein